MIALPTTPAQVLSDVVLPTLQHLLPGKFDSPEARVMLLAIGGQESGFRTRQQVGGPARGLWQAEQGGSIRGVLGNRSSSAYARSVCLLRAVAPVESDVYSALLTDDMLACAFARLTLWDDPHPLPALGNASEAWDCYVQNWRPGKPRPDDWHANYAAALQAVTA